RQYASRRAARRPPAGEADTGEADTGEADTGEADTGEADTGEAGTGGLTPRRSPGGGTRMDRFWLLTWTTYGSWLPGDARGFVSEVRDETGAKVLHDEPGTAYDADLPPLQAYAASIMTE